MVKNEQSLPVESSNREPRIGDFKRKSQMSIPPNQTQKIINIQLKKDHSKVSLSNNNSQINYPEQNQEMLAIEKLEAKKSAYSNIRFKDKIRQKLSSS